VEASPSYECEFIYYMSLLLLSVLTFFFQLFNLSKITFVQMFFTIYRFVAFLLIVVSCLVSLLISDSTWTSNPCLPPWYSFQHHSFPTLYSSLSFSLSGGVNIPNLIPPLRRPKPHAARVAAAAIPSLCVMYVPVSPVCALAIGPDIIQFVILNWAIFGARGFNSFSAGGGGAGGAPRGRRRWGRTGGRQGPEWFRYIFSCFPSILRIFFHTLGIISEFSIYMLMLIYGVVSFGRTIYQLVERAVRDRRCSYFYACSYFCSCSCSYSYPSFIF
jgi:hypothetical protein